jgi:hypothetical protein
MTVIENGLMSAGHGSPGVHAGRPLDAIVTVPLLTAETTHSR